MAIADIAAYAHLTDEDIEALGYELEEIRRDIEESLGERDAAYIRHTILFQRTLDVV
ncbi:acyl-CoA desaturase, partial [Mycobacterium sp. ITM-2017-0098]